MYTIQYWPGLSNNLLLLLHLCDNKVKLFSVSSLTTINVTHIHLDNNCINKIHHKVRIIEKKLSYYQNAFTVYTSISSICTVKTNVV